MNIFEFSDYRQILRKLVDERKELDRKINFQSVAKAARIPSSYLSKALRGDANLNADQLYAIARFFDLGDRPIRFLLLLLDYDRSILPDRRRAIQEELNQIARDALETKEHLATKSIGLSEESVAEFYADPLIQIVHICLSIERYLRAPLTIAADLRIDPARVGRGIDTLERLNVVERDADGRITVLIRSLHLPRTARIFRTWRNETKLMTLHRLNDGERADDYSFSVVFSGDRKTAQTLRKKFLDYLKDVEASVKSAPCDDVFQMSFDLFGWTR